MVERRCRYCEQVFQPSKFQPGQSVCSGPDCQRRRRAENRQRKIAADPEYRQVCQDSSSKWRAATPITGGDAGIAIQPASSVTANCNSSGSETAAARSCKQQLSFRPKAFRCRGLAHWPWPPEHLANNNSALAQIWVLEALPPRRGPQIESCQQQRSGLDAVSAG